MMHPTRKKTLLLFLQGSLIGTGAILPGVSGGVLAVAFGIYEPMMQFLSHPFQGLKRNLSLLLPVLTGGAIGFILLAKVAEILLSASAAAAMALFCGLICGTIPELFRKSVAEGERKGWSAFILTLVVSYAFFQMLSGSIETEISPNTLWFVFCGAVWGLSMIIPGLSSSSVLLFMGLYQPMAAGIGNLDLQVLIPLALGFTVTILIAARLVNSLLNRYYAVFSKTILGFVISSVLMIVPTSFGGAGMLLLCTAAFAAGFILSRLMESWKKE